MKTPSIIAIMQAITDEKESRKNKISTKSVPKMVAPYSIPYPRNDVDRKTWIKQKINKIPLLNSFLSWGLAVYRLPKIIPEIFSRLDDNSSRIEKLEFRLQTQVESRLSTLEGATARLSKLEETVAELDPRQLSVHESKINDTMSLDELYFHFENQFRGSRELVKERLVTYLPLLRSRPIDYQLYPVIDIGSGRGEWLELLAGEKIRAKGVDTNQYMVNYTKEMGLDTFHADAFHYLRNLPDSSLGGISGFHIVEHLKFYDLLRLLKECRRVLVPEGFVLFETPNPENLRVGSCDFYTDPTHINPIPPATLAFLISNSGFPIMETMRLSADSLDLGQDVSLPLRAVAASYYAARDYGIFAFKSSGDI